MTMPAGGDEEAREVGILVQCRADLGFAVGCMVTPDSAASGAHKPSVNIVHLI